MTRPPLETRARPKTRTGSAVACQSESLSRRNGCYKMRHNASGPTAAAPAAQSRITRIAGRAGCSMVSHMKAQRRVRLESPSLRRESAFLDAVSASTTLHAPWVSPPATPEHYRAYVRRMRLPTHIGHLVVGGNGVLAGVININEIVRGVFRSGYLGYYAFVPVAGQGYMRAGLRAVLSRAFGEYRLHRLEANIQPGNDRSRALVKSLGFRLEGYSPNYLEIGGAWRDHERWALTWEDWIGGAPAAAIRRTASRRLRGIRTEG